MDRAPRSWSSSGEVDSKYEFDAPRFFDFTRADVTTTKEGSPNSDAWFDSATSEHLSEVQEPPNVALMKQADNAESSIMPPAESRITQGAVTEKTTPQKQHTPQNSGQASYDRVRTPRPSPQNYSWRDPVSNAAPLPPPSGGRLTSSKHALHSPASGRSPFKLQQMESFFSQASLQPEASDSSLMSPLFAFPNPLKASTTPSRSPRCGKENQGSASKCVVIPSSHATSQAWPDLASLQDSTNRPSMSAAEEPISLAGHNVTLTSGGANGAAGRASVACLPKNEDKGEQEHEDKADGVQWETDLVARESLVTSSSTYGSDDDTADARDTKWEHLSSARAAGPSSTAGGHQLLPAESCEQGTSFQALASSKNFPSGSPILGVLHPSAQRSKIGREQGITPRANLVCVDWAKDGGAPQERKHKEGEMHWATGICVPAMAAAIEARMHRKKVEDATKASITPERKIGVRVFPRMKATHCHDASGGQGCQSAQCEGGADDLASQEPGIFEDGTQPPILQGSDTRPDPSALDPSPSPMELCGLAKDACATTGAAAQSESVVSAQGSVEVQGTPKKELVDSMEDMQGIAELGSVQPKKSDKLAMTAVKPASKGRKWPTAPKTEGVLTRAMARRKVQGQDNVAAAPATLAASAEVLHAELASTSGPTDSALGAAASAEAAEFNTEDAAAAVPQSDHNKQANNTEGCLADEAISKMAGQEGEGPVEDKCMKIQGLEVEKQEAAGGEAAAVLAPDAEVEGGVESAAAGGPEEGVSSNENMEDAGSSGQGGVDTGSEVDAAFDEALEQDEALATHVEVQFPGENEAPVPGSAGPEVEEEVASEAEDDGQEEEVDFKKGEGDGEEGLGGKVTLKATDGAAVNQDVQHVNTEEEDEAQAEEEGVQDGLQLVGGQGEGLQEEEGDNKETAVRGQNDGSERMAKDAEGAVQEEPSEVEAVSEKEELLLVQADECQGEEEEESVAADDDAGKDPEEERVEGDGDIVEEEEVQGVKEAEEAEEGGEEAEEAEEGGEEAEVGVEEEAEKEEEVDEWNGTQSSPLPIRVLESSFKLVSDSAQGQKIAARAPQGQLSSAGAFGSPIAAGKASGQAVIPTMSQAARPAAGNRSNAHVASQASQANKAVAKKAVVGDQGKTGAGNGSTMMSLKGGLAAPRARGQVKPAPPAAAAVKPTVAKAGVAKVTAQRPALPQPAAANAASLKVSAPAAAAARKPAQKPAFGSSGRREVPAPVLPNPANPEQPKRSVVFPAKAKSPAPKSITGQVAGRALAQALARSRAAPKAGGGKKESVTGLPVNPSGHREPARQSLSGQGGGQASLSGSEVAGAQENMTLGATRRGRDVTAAGFQEVGRESKKPRGPASAALQKVLAPKGAVLPPRPEKPLTVPEPVELRVDKRVRPHDIEIKTQAKEFVSLASQVNQFENLVHESHGGGPSKVPDEDCNSQHRADIKAGGAGTSYISRKLTVPVSPLLVTAKRARPSTERSTTEREEEEMANMPKVKAVPLRPEIFEQPARLPPRPQLPLTEPQSVDLKTRKRAASRGGVTKEETTAAEVAARVPQDARGEAAHGPGHLTVPVSPLLHTKKRSRPAKDKTTEERELEELALHPKFHAKPVDPRIMRAGAGPIGLPPRPQLPLTRPKGFNLQVDQRAQMRGTTGANENQIGERKEKRKAGPKMLPDGRPALIEIQPFSLQTDLRGEAKRQKMEMRLHAEEEATSVRMPKARGLPLTTDRPQELVKPPVKPPTAPQPFHLRSVARHEEEVRRRQQQLEEEQAREEDERRNAFHPRPVPDYQALRQRIPEPERRALTKAEEVHLWSNNRAAHRSEFDQRVAEQRQAEEEHRAELQRLQQEREREEVKRLRAGMVHHPKPLPAFMRNRGAQE